MEEFISNIIETGLGYIPEFTMKDIVILAVSLIICLIFALFGYKLLKGFVALINLLVGAFVGLSIADFLKLDVHFIWRFFWHLRSYFRLSVSFSTKSDSLWS